MTLSAADRPPPRERLLDAADHLFYEQGVCTVGVDRILQDADAARASLYKTFGSKDELVRAYLQRRDDQWRATVTEVLPTRWATPRERIIGMFMLLTERFAAPGYRGCPFINASAEAESGRAVVEIRDGHRAWVRALFADLAHQGGAGDPGALAAQLVLLFDGAAVGADLDHSDAPGHAAQAAAEALLDAAGAA